MCLTNCFSKPFDRKSCLLAAPKHDIILGVSRRVSIKLSPQKKKIQCMGVCVGCAGIITCYGKVSLAQFFLGIFACVNGEISGRVESDWPAYHFEE